MPALVGPVDAQLALTLAARGLGCCRLCKQIGPLNGALSAWWAGVPIMVVCPECFSQGRSIVMTRHPDGMEVRTLDGDSRRIVLSTEVPTAASLSQPTAANRTQPERLWTGETMQEAAQKVADDCARDEANNHLRCHEQPGPPVAYSLPHAETARKG